jgi:hypothetical protein
MLKKHLSLFLIFCFLASFIQPVFAEEYQLAPGDILDIKILNKKELNVNQSIAPDGTISLPLLGRKTVITYTLRTFQTYLNREYTKYFKNPDILIKITPRPIYVIEKGPSGSVVKVHHAKSVEEAKALSGDFGADIKHGDIVEVKSRLPIYVVLHDVAKNKWDVKTAKTIEEARAFAGKDFTGEIKYGDTVTVEVGKKPDFFEDNWYKIITAVSVVVGVLVTVSR